MEENEQCLRFCEQCVSEQPIEEKDNKIVCSSCGHRLDYDIGHIKAVIMWVTWKKIDEENNKVNTKKTMFASGDGTTKKELRMNLTEKFQNEDKPIIEVTGRRYRKRPHWLKEPTWKQIIGEEQ